MQLTLQEARAEGLVLIIRATNSDGDTYIFNTSLAEIQLGKSIEDPGSIELKILNTVVDLRLPSVKIAP